MQKNWLKDWPWDTVVLINVALCKEKEITPQTNPTGYEAARQLWEHLRHEELSLHQALGVCRRAHQLSPFALYNGNTFAAIGRTMVSDILGKMTPDKAQVFRSVVGHYIAGTTGDEELASALQMAEH
jgi:hypothetical protein